MIIREAEAVLNEAKLLVHDDPIKIATTHIQESSQRREVFLVDTDENLLKILRTAFESHGLKVYTFTSGTEVIERLKMLDHLLPPLVITERMLPDIDGLQLAQSLQKLPFDVPIMFISSLSSEKDVFDGLKMGALDYIVKPFSIDVLIQKSLNALMQTI